MTKKSADFLPVFPLLPRRRRMSHCSEKGTSNGLEKDVGRGVISFSLPAGTNQLRTHSLLFDMIREIMSWAGNRKNDCDLLSQVIGVTNLSEGQGNRSTLERGKEDCDGA